jgi:hypothetical protein
VSKLKNIKKARYAGNVDGIANIRNSYDFRGEEYIERVAGPKAMVSKSTRLSRETLDRIR